MLAFTLLYIAVPNRDVDWRDAAWGGLLAALAFEVAKRGFGEFIQNFPPIRVSTAHWPPCRCSSCGFT